MGFKTYLSKRHRHVMIGEIKSGSLDIAFGVSHGSIFGPKLFHLYINDILTVTKLLKLILFVEDTNLFHSSDNYDLFYNKKDFKKLKHGWIIIVFLCNVLCKL